MCTRYLKQLGNLHLLRYTTLNTMVSSITKLVVLITLLFTALTAKSKPRKKVVPYPRVRGACEVHKGWLIRRDECDIRIPTYGCRGGCFSSARPFSHRIGFASSCSCCAPIKSVIIEIKVPCNGQTKVIRYPVAKKCACRPCLNGS